MGVILLLSLALPTRAITYARVTDIKTRQLTNGVQITIAADGILTYKQTGLPAGGASAPISTITLVFPGARSALSSNFINVAAYPVSFIQIQTPQDAPEGVGLQMMVSLFSPEVASVTTSPDRQSVIINVNSDRTIAASPSTGEAGGTAPAVAAEEPMVVAVDANNRVHLRAVSADIHEVLARLAHAAGINIVVDDKVNRKVSLVLDDMDADDVIHAIASGYGLALSRFDGVYMVSEGVPTDLATYHLSGTQSFRLNFIQAQQASGLLPTFLFQYLHVNNGQNAVVVTAPTQMLAKIGADLSSLDVQPPLIEVDALAVEFTDTEDAERSLGFRLHNGDRTSAFDTNAGTLQYQAIGQLPYSFSATLNALVQQGKAQIRANPRLAVLNGQNASLFIGDQRYIQVQYIAYGGTQTSIQGVDVGTRLSVTPWTGGNGEITTRIQPEVSNISQLDLNTGLPVLSDRKADTTVRVKDGESIVIGGLVQRQSYVTHGKIPILGEIPLIGSLFRTNTKTTTRSDLVIFITPHILDPDGHIPDESAARRAEEQRLLHTLQDK
jgi:type IV pilus assembly protein PilQ